MDQSTRTEADTVLEDNPPDARGARRWLAEQSRPVRLLMLAATGSGLLAGWITIAQAGLIAAIVHALVVQGTDRNALMVWFVLWLLTIPLRSLLMALREHASLHAALGVRRRLRQRLSRHIMDLGPIGVRQLGQGRVSSVLLDQVNALEGYYARFLPQLPLSLLVPLSVLVVVFLLDWLAALLLLFAAPLIPLFMALVGMGAATVHRRQFQALERLSGYFLDRLQGLETLRHLGRGGATVVALQDNADKYRRRTMSVLRVAFLSSAVLEFFSSVAIAMTAIYIGLGLLGYLTLGPAEQLTLFSGLFILLLAPEVFSPLRDLATHYHDRAAALGAATGIRELLDASSPARPRSGQKTVSTIAPFLELDGVTVSYDQGGAAVLRELSFEVPAASTTLLTGPSGSGKTSLLMVLLGLLDPHEGQVRINGIAVPELAPGALEARVGWLGQNPRLLPGTIRENILLGRPDAPRAALESAAREAGVLRFTDRLPDGLDTRVGERGSGISGGEAQRVALARALLRDPPLLVLDEPTASLDPESRGIVLDVLQRMHGQRTQVIATHQPAQFPWADRRVELAAAEVGTQHHG